MVALRMSDSPQDVLLRPRHAVLGLPAPFGDVPFHPRGTDRVPGTTDGSRASTMSAVETAHILYVSKLSDINVKRVTFGSVSGMLANGFRARGVRVAYARCELASKRTQRRSFGFLPDD